jgi:speckle-type POZ protein
MAIESTSSSRCVTGKVTATHDFEVTNFSVLDGMGMDKFVSSSTFSAGGCDWRIDLYPDGIEANKRAYMYLVSGTAGVSVAFSLSLLLVLGNKDQVITKQLSSFFKDI